MVSEGRGDSSRERNESTYLRKLENRPLELMLP